MSWPIGIAYLVASLTFVAGLRLLSSPVTATNGNRVAAAGMTLAVAATFFMQGMHPQNFPFIVVALAAGAVIGIGTSLKVKMTAMPQMVALFNGMGGGAAALGSMLEYIHTPTASAQTLTAGLSTGIGAVSFAGSMIAFAKLQEIMAGSAYRWPWGRYVNAVLLLLMLAAAGVLTAGHPTGSSATLWLVVLVTLALSGSRFRCGDSCTASRGR